MKLLLYLCLKSNWFSLRHYKSLYLVTWYNDDTSKPFQIERLGDPFQPLSRLECASLLCIFHSLPRLSVELLPTETAPYVKISNILFQSIGKCTDSWLEILDVGGTLLAFCCSFFFFLVSCTEEFQGIKFFYYNCQTHKLTTVFTESGHVNAELNLPLT